MPPQPLWRIDSSILGSGGLCAAVDCLFESWLYESFPFLSNSRVFSALFVGFIRLVFSLIASPSESLFYRLCLLILLHFRGGFSCLFEYYYLKLIILFRKWSLVQDLDKNSTQIFSFLTVLRYLNTSLIFNY